MLRLSCQARHVYLEVELVYLALGKGSSNVVNFLGFNQQAQMIESQCAGSLKVEF